jgi:hypothetical protein
MADIVSGEQYRYALTNFVSSLPSHRELTLILTVTLALFSTMHLQLSGI